MLGVKNKLINTHPQKYCLKLICGSLFYLGAGECWYEKRVMTKKQKFLYMIWSVISNGYIFGVFFNEYFAFLRSDLTDAEKEDLYFYTLAHSSIFAKFVVLQLQKNRIKVLFKRFLEDNRDYYSLEIEKASLKNALLFSLVLCFGVYLTLVSAMANAVKVHIVEGIPIRTEVTYYPKNTTPSTPFNIFRFLMEFHWYYAVTIMILIDCLCVSCLVFVGHKFKYLQMYFKGLRKNFLDNPKMKSKNVLEKEYEEGILVGIKQHQHYLCVGQLPSSVLSSAVYSLMMPRVEAKHVLDWCLWLIGAGGCLVEVLCLFLHVILREGLCTLAFTSQRHSFSAVLVAEKLKCARNVQYALGNVYSIQVVQSLILLVLCLIKMVAAGRNLTFFLAYFTFSCCIVLLTGAYMMAGGAITTEAGLIGTSVFQSGWELNQARQSLRTLLVIALVNSEVPVLMTAFGIITLSYSNFLMVLRHSYSFFAVMY